MSDKIYRFQKTKSLYSAKYRIIYPQAIYHLIQRAPGSEKLFLQEEDYLRMLSLMKETQRRFKWRFFSFALMSNHIHNLIQIAKENLSQGAKFLFESYAKSFNKKYERKGPVFCKPYKAFLCLNDSYLLAISIYIHLNPYKARLVDNPFKYRWSSIRLYIEDKNPRSFVNYDFILSMLDRDRTKAREIYKKLIEESAGMKFEDVFEKPTFIRKFCFNITKLKNSLLKTDDFKKKAEEFSKIRYGRGRSQKIKKKKLIMNFIDKGYSISEIALILALSRQQIYRILKNVT